MSQPIDFVGKHVFEGCDTGLLSPEGDGTGSAIRFALDGKVYQADEDPSDGYRSSCNEIKECTVAIQNAFAPHEVVGTMRARDFNSNDVVDFIDAVTGKLVLSVGTSNDDDYYPSFVADFMPENLAINQPKP